MDWRAYAAVHTLTDRQAKLAQKVRKREARVSNLQREVDKIRVRALRLGADMQVATAHAHCPSPALRWHFWLFTALLPNQRRREGPCTLCAGACMHTPGVSARCPSVCGSALRHFAL